MAARVVPQHVQPCMRIETAVVPDGASAGDTIPVSLADGSQFEVQVPQGVGPGQSFQFQAPEAPTPVAVAQPVAPIAPVAAQPVQLAEGVIAGQPVQGVVLGASAGAAGAVPGGFRPVDGGMVPPGAPPGGWMVRER